MRRAQLLISAIFGLVACGPPALPGTTSPSIDNILQDQDTIGKNVIHTTTYQIPNVFLGACANESGFIVGGKCIPNVTPIDKARPLPAAKFRNYSQLVKLDVSGAAGGGGGAVESSAHVVHSSHRFVLEWSRYNPQSVELPGDLGRPVVTSVDVGIAIRVVFDVSLQSTDVSAAANFGFAKVSTALALGKATIQGRYDMVGVLRDIIPTTNAFNIASVEDFVKAQNVFYDAIVKTSRSWDDIGTGGTPPQFAPDIVGYTVSNIPSGVSVGGETSFAGGYLTGVSTVKLGIACKDWLDKLPGEAKKDSSFVSGFVKAHRDLMKTSECERTKPNAIQRATATEAWKVYVLPRVDPQ